MGAPFRRPKVEATESQTGLNKQRQKTGKVCLFSIPIAHGLCSFSPGVGLGNRRVGRPPETSLV